MHVERVDAATASNDYEAVVDATGALWLKNKDGLWAFVDANGEVSTALVEALSDKDAPYLELDEGAKILVMEATDWK